MRKAGLEPARLAALEPKSSASTSSATFARGGLWGRGRAKKKGLHCCNPFVFDWWAVKDSNLGPID